MLTYNKEKYIQLSGDLFKEVQTQKIFSDSKTFVDSIPKENPENIIKEYNALKTKPGFCLKDFITRKFYLPENETVELNLPKNRTMEEHIILLWDYLVRKPQAHFNNYSTLIPLIDEYVVPGGRFREVYYWDSYFTMLGLYASGRFDLIKKMINNFSYLVDNFGFIPNGNRIYYLSRSQPPFFPLMVNLAKRINSKAKDNLYYISLIEKEYNFWMRADEKELSEMKNHLHVVQIPNDELLNRYFDSENIPRAEAFSEDAEVHQKIGDKFKDKLYSNIRAAAESGWDFSSRWFEDGKNLTTIETTDILPVDLNCLLAYSELLLSNLYSAYNQYKSDFYKERFGKRLNLIRNLFWDKKEGFFFDYNHKMKKLKDTYTLAAVFPLYFGFAEKHQAEKVAKKIESIFLKDGGLVTTLNNTGQQWDAPNGWPPLQWIAIVGLRNYGLYQIADEIKKRWLKLNESVFNQTGSMFEKYNVENINLPGGGGEYSLQDGFGWTNGVALALIKNLDYSIVM